MGNDFVTHLCHTVFYVTKNLKVDFSCAYGGGNIEKPVSFSVPVWIPSLFMFKKNVHPVTYNHLSIC